MKKINKSWIIAVVTCVCVFALIGWFIVDVTECNEYTYNIEELKDDVYAISYRTHSNVPAQNYQVVTLCCNGTIRTFQGHVYINYTDDTPYAFIKDTNIVNGDEIYVYVPKGTVEYGEGVNINS